MSNEDFVLQYQSSADPDEQRDLLSQLYEQNIGLIASIVKVYASFEDEDDLRQEAYFGLVRAADQWSPEGGASFSTYSRFWIRQAVRRYLDDCGSPLRIPAYMLELVYRYRTTTADFISRHGRQPSDNELCYLLEISPEKLQDVKKTANQRRLRSTNEELTEDGSITLGDAIADPQDRIEEEEERLRNEELSKVLWGIVDGLPEDESRVVRRRYQEGKTMLQCADGLGTSLAKIRNIEARALRKMRQGKRANQLRPFLEDYAEQYAFSSPGIGAFKRTGSSAVERAVIAAADKRERERGE